MKYILSLFVTICLLQFVSNAQDPDVKYTMGYKSIDIKLNNTNVLTRYLRPGKEVVCGFYSKYNNTLYHCDGTVTKEINEEYLQTGGYECCNGFLFNDGPRPYAMMELPLEIINVDYETNTITARMDGADVTIVTVDEEIDLLYKRFFKVQRLDNVKCRMILKNWAYEPESMMNHEVAMKPFKKKVKWKKRGAKNAEKYLHDSEYMK
jgi:hypothetical protein